MIKYEEQIQVDNSIRADPVATILIHGETLLLLLSAV
jgi:hypothetical protein